LLVEVSCLRSSDVFSWPCLDRFVQSILVGLKVTDNVSVQG